MAVTIPAGDVVNAAIATEITALSTTITNNPLLAEPLRQQQASLQYQLVQNLMAAAIGGSGSAGNALGVFASHLQPATILSSCSVNT